VNRKSTLVLAVTFFLVAALQSCSNSSSQEVRSDNTEIARLLTDDATAQQIVPQIWIDTTVHTVDQGTAKTNSALGYINPADYWVEVVSHSRGFTFRDSCSADSLSTTDPCASIPLETGGRAKAKIAQVTDTIECIYHILVREGDSVRTVTKPNIRVLGTTWVLAAQMGISDAHYNGWAIYATGRQRQAENYVGSLPKLDSIMIRPQSGDFTYYPRASVHYRPIVSFPEIEPGETFSVYVYTSPRYSGGDLFYEAYLHQMQNGVFKHERVGTDIGERLVFQATESSGLSSGDYSQIVLELFPFSTLRDDSPAAFGTSLFAITYQIE
jgi:hypothetical protein